MKSTDGMHAVSSERARKGCRAWRFMAIDTFNENFEGIG